MKIQSQLLLDYTVVFALMIVIAGITFQSITALLETQRGPHHVHEVIAHSISVEKSVMDMQTAKRGFQITGNEEYLEPYQDGKKRL